MNGVIQAITERETTLTSNTAVLNFENVDFDHVEQTINGTILYCICSCNVINKEVNDIKNIDKKNYELLAESMSDLNFHIYYKYSQHAVCVY